jgi:serine/threonine protein kinase
LGGGASAQVWLAENVSSSGKYAIKVMELSTIRSRKIAINEQIIQENIKFRSPYLISYFQSFNAKNKMFIVMEYCEHKDLQTLYLMCKENDLPIVEDKILSIIAQLMIGIYILHSYRILHRDIKPQNIFIDKNNNLKLGLCSFKIYICLNR